MIRIYIIAILLAYIGHASACICEDFSAEEGYEKAKIVFLGEIKDKTILKDMKSLSALKVLEVYKGQLNKNEKVFVDTLKNNTCEGPGHEYAGTKIILFLTPKKSGEYILSKCNFKLAQKIILSDGEYGPSEGEVKVLISKLKNKMPNKALKPGTPKNGAP